MNRISLAFLLVISLLFSACDRQPSVLEPNCAFDLEKVNFGEDVPLLYSKNMAGKYGLPHNRERDGEASDDLLRYRIRNTIIDLLDLQVPQKEFGYLYPSVQLDSLARFGGAYFNSLSTLTDNNRRPVAYSASTEYAEADERGVFVSNLEQKYGKPEYEINIGGDFYQRSYQWTLADRTLQVVTSQSFNFGVSDGDGGSLKRYILKMLIIDNRAIDALREAHTYQLPDSMSGNVEVFDDNFALTTWFDEYMRDGYR